MPVLFNARRLHLSRKFRDEFAIQDQITIFF
jgi:hypothetical protein